MEKNFSQDLIFCLVGPSGSGKTRATIDLSERWPIEVINVDSGTIYKGMDIGTAKPSAEQQGKITQHLLDIKDANQKYSCAEFFNDVKNIISEIRQRGKIPFLVGGTMLYFRVLHHGLAHLPEANANLRHILKKEARENGWHTLHKELKIIDPLTANRLSINDKQRIQRAIEVYRITGRPISSFTQEKKNWDKIPGNLISISLEPMQRDYLFKYIEKRFDEMLEIGLVNEVRDFHKRDDLNLEFPSMRCIGYRQFWKYLDGMVDWKLARSQSISATKKLIKHQMTWLKTQPDRILIECHKKDSYSKIIDVVSRFMKNGSI